MKCFFTLVPLVFHCHTSISLVNPTPFAPCGHMKSHAHNNEEMAFVHVCTETCTCTCAGKVLRRFRSAGEYEAVSCKNEDKYTHNMYLYLRLSTEEKLGFGQFYI